MMQKVASDIGVGTDIEVFLWDNKKAAIVPSVGILPGTKDKPFRPKGYPKGFAIQEDNVMVEFNIPPSSGYAVFNADINKAIIMVLEELTLRHGNKYSLYTQAHTHTFKARHLTSNQAKMIGCEPDFDAYNGGAMRKEAPIPTHMRSCGGHIHLGGDFQCPDFVAALFAELFFGVQCRMTAKSDDPRTKWYGKPGVFRPKPYGIEYRTPNNHWAVGGNSRDYVGDTAIRLATWLTQSDALTIQTAFRKIPWVDLKKYMVMDSRSPISKDIRSKLQYKAQKAGVPL